MTAPWWARRARDADEPVASLADRGTLPAASRVVHSVDERAARPLTSVLVAIAVVAALVVIVATGFDTTVQADFASVCSAITVVMVFVLQHTQRRAQIATQLKLDELIAAMPQADDRIVHVESSTNDELESLVAERREHHASLRGDDDDETGPASI